MICEKLCLSLILKIKEEKCLRFCRENNIIQKESGSKICFKNSTFFVIF